MFHNNDSWIGLGSYDRRPCRGPIRRTYWSYILRWIRPFEGELVVLYRVFHLLIPSSRQIVSCGEDQVRTRWGIVVIDADAFLAIEDLRLGLLSWNRHFLRKASLMSACFLIASLSPRFVKDSVSSCMLIIVRTCFVERLMYNIVIWRKKIATAASGALHNVTYTDECLVQRDYILLASRGGPDASRRISSSRDPAKRQVIARRRILPKIS